MSSWAVAALTVVLFASFAFSAARRTFMSGLEAKAVTVASSVNDVVVKNQSLDDTARLQQHCQKMLTDDATLSYITLTYSNEVTVVYRALYHELRGRLPSGRFGGLQAIQESSLSVCVGGRAADSRQKGMFVGKVAPSPPPLRKS